LEIECKSIR